jgi:hypothetical protein
MTWGQKGHAATAAVICQRAGREDGPSRRQSGG